MITTGGFRHALLQIDVEAQIAQLRALNGRSGRVTELPLVVNVRILQDDGVDGVYGVLSSFCEFRPGALDRLNFADGRWTAPTPKKMWTRLVMNQQPCPLEMWRMLQQCHVGCEIVVCEHDDTSSTSSVAAVQA